MYGFHLLVYVLCVRGVQDTQCGFKMMTRAAAGKLFQNMHIDRWLALYFNILLNSSQATRSIIITSCRAFDVEMLYIGQQLGMPIKEVPVNWQEIDGRSVY